VRLEGVGKLGGGEIQRPDRDSNPCECEDEKVMSDFSVPEACPEKHPSFTENDAARRPSGAAGDLRDRRETPAQLQAKGG
jgi:hypothetical protein